MHVCLSCLKFMGATLNAVAVKKLWEVQENLLVKKVRKLRKETVTTAHFLDSRVFLAQQGGSKLKMAKLS